MTQLLTGAHSPRPPGRGSIRRLGAAYKTSRGRRQRQPLLSHLGPALPLLLLLVAASSLQQWSMAASAAPASAGGAANPARHDIVPDTAAEQPQLRAGRGGGGAAQRQLLQAPGSGTSPALAQMGDGNFTTEGTSYNNPADFPVPTGYE